MDDEEIRRFESNLIKELESSTRPVFPQLLNKYSQINDKDNQNGKLKNVIFTYSLLALTCPEMFPLQPQLIIQQNTKYLGNFLIAKGTFPLTTEVESFLVDFAKNISEEDELLTNLTNGLWYVIGQEIYSHAKNLKVNSLATWIITNCPVFVKYLTYFPCQGIFEQGINGTEFINMLPSTRHPDMDNNSVPIGALMIPKSTLDSILSNCRSENTLTSNDAYRLCLALIKSNLRQISIDFFQQHLVENYSRTKLQREEKVVGDLYAFNFEGMMLLFCQPFIADLEKIISPMYKPSNKDLNRVLEESTTIIDSINDNNNDVINVDSFINHCFWLSILAMNEGTGSILRNCNGLLKELNELINMKNTINPAQRPLWHKKLCQLVDEKLSLDLFLLDPKRISYIQAFLAFAMTKFLKFDRLNYSRIPEFVFDLFLDIFIYWGHLKVRWDEKVDIISDFMIFLLDKESARSPYLRAKIIELLMTKFISMDCLNCEKLSILLIEFYVQVEKTGASTGFYDKFSIRYQLASVMMELLDHPQHSKAMQNLVKSIDSATCPFVHFVNLLLNDVTYLLDESLLKLQEIHNKISIQTDIANIERQLTSYMQLANVGCDLLERFTRSTPTPFTRPEIITRFANMLNLVTVQLAGPQCRDLKVQDPEKYHFRPRELLSKLCQIYSNMSGQDDFIKAVAADGRSFKPSVLKRAANLAGSQGLLLVLENISKSSINEPCEQKEEEEVPEEFLDQLMFTVMDDPVMLPSSRAVLDRGTIIAHLLNQQNDPFNRSPLKIKDLISQPQLKEKIDNWKQQKSKKNPK